MIFRIITLFIVDILLILISLYVVDNFNFWIAIISGILILLLSVFLTIKILKLEFKNKKNERECENWYL
jgi:hypothetical protein